MSNKPNRVVAWCYWREHICNFFISNQCPDLGFLGLLCPVSKWFFPFVCSSSDGLSLSDRVLVGLLFSHSHRTLSLPLKPSSILWGSPSHRERPHVFLWWQSQLRSQLTSSISHETCKQVSSRQFQPPASELRQPTLNGAGASYLCKFCLNCRFVSERNPVIVFSHRASGWFVTRA